jgi:uncharacterized protein HemX
MKKNKFNFDWKSVLLGGALCLALVVFVASMAQTTQTETQKRISTQGNQTEARQGATQKMVTTNDLMAKCELIDQRILILEGKITHMQERVEYVLEILGNMSRQNKQ